MAIRTTLMETTMGLTRPSRIARVPEFSDKAPGSTAIVAAFCYLQIPGPTKQLDRFQHGFIFPEMLRSPLVEVVAVILSDMCSDPLATRRARTGMNLDFELILTGATGGRPIMV